MLEPTGFDSEQVDNILRDLAALGEPGEGGGGSGESAPDEFAEYGEDIETEYCCPKCKYRWSGSAS